MPSRFFLWAMVLVLLAAAVSAVDYNNISTPYSGSADLVSTRQGIMIRANGIVNLTAIRVDAGTVNVNRMYVYNESKTLLITCSNVVNYVCNLTPAVTLDKDYIYWIAADNNGSNYNRKSIAIDPAQFPMVNYAANIIGGFYDIAVLWDNTRVHNGLGVYTLNVTGGGGGGDVAPATPTYTSPTPADGYRTNQNVTINCSSPTSLNLKYYANFATKTSNVIKVFNVSQGTPYYSFNTNISDGNYTYNCFLQNITSGLFSLNVTQTIQMDTVTPTINLSYANAFNISNRSNVNQYNTAMPLNITFADESILFGVLINITKGGVSFYNYSNITITGNSSILFTKQVDITDWGAGVYSINLTAVDAHTSSIIDDYKSSTFFDTVSFDTAEKNKVHITAYGSYSSEVTKEPASYSFGFHYLLPLKERSFFVEIESGYINYIEGSKYNAHFVICQKPDCSSGGNWLDFEGLGKYTLKHNDAKSYEIAFTDLTPSQEIETHSIGGLNVNTQNYKWYRGVASKAFTTPALSGSWQNLFLNVTKDSDYINALQAKFIYNGTEKAVTKTTGTAYDSFMSTVWLPDGNQMYNFTWYINVTQATGNYTFNVSDTQEALKGQLNITIFEEKNMTLLTGVDITVYITQDTSLVLNTSTGKAIAANISIGEQRIEASGANYPRRGQYVTVTNMTQNVYLFLLSSMAGNQYIDYTVRDNGDTNLEDVRVSWYRNFNGTTYTVAQYDTDFAGQARLYQDSIYEYPMSLIKTSYPPTFINLLPITTAYLIRMESPTTTNYRNLYEGISYSLKPSAHVFNRTNQFVNFTFGIYADDNSLEYFGIQVTNTTLPCYPAICLINVSTTGAGGVATLGVNMSSLQRFELSLFMKRRGFEMQVINGDSNSVEDIASFLFGTVADRFNELSAGLNSPALKAVIASFGIVALCVIAAQLGVIGAGLVIAAMLATVFFTIVGYISVFIGLTVGIIGVLAFLVSSRDD